MIKLKHILNKYIRIKDKTNVNETIEGDRIDCDKCDHSWPKVTGGNDLYTCHECGHDNTPQKNNKKTNNYDN